MTQLIVRWRCYACPECGAGPRSNAAAEKHTRDEGHSTCTWTETACQDTENGPQSGTLGDESEAVPEVRQHQGDLTASPRPTRPGGGGL